VVFVLLALAASAAAVWIAYHRHGHPGDFLVAAVLAIHVAVFVVVLSPTPTEHRLLLGHGMPARAVAWSAYLLSHGSAIEWSAILLAAGACLAALVRRRKSPDLYAPGPAIAG
jgi:hypothetical protein